MRIERISKDTSSYITIEDVKAYANITGTARDEELNAMLVSAIIKVEDIAGVSITPNVFKLYTEGVTTLVSLYYLPIGSITSVKDILTGDIVDYTAYYDFSKITLDSRDVVIQYSTLPTCSNALQLKQNVIEYCSILYDGQTDQNVINSVLNKIPRTIC